MYCINLYHKLAQLIFKELVDLKQKGYTEKELQMTVTTLYVEGTTSAQKMKSLLSK